MSQHVSAALSTTFILWTILPLMSQAVPVTEGSVDEIVAEPSAAASPTPAAVSTPAPPPTETVIITTPHAHPTCILPYYIAPEASCRRSQFRDCTLVSTKTSIAPSAYPGYVVDPVKHTVGPVCEGVCGGATLGCCLTEDQGETNYIYYKEHCTGAHTDPISKSVRDHVTKSVQNYDSHANVSPGGKLVLRPAGRPQLKARPTTKLGLRPGDVKAWSSKSSAAKSKTATPETATPEVPDRSRSVKPHEKKSAAPASSDAVYTYSNADCFSRASFKYINVPFDTCLTIPVAHGNANDTAHMKLTRSNQAVAANPKFNSTDGDTGVYTVLLYSSSDTTCSSTALHQFSYGYVPPYSSCTADTSSTPLSEWRSIQVKPTKTKQDATETVDCQDAAKHGICSPMETEVHKSAAPQATEPRLMAMAFISSVALVWQFAM